MRKLALIAVMFFCLAAPAHAESRDDGFLLIFLGPVQLFVVNNSSPLTFTYDEYSDFGVAQDLGDVNYDLISNVAWQVNADVNDGPGGGMTPGDWDPGWTLTLNGVVIDVGGGTDVIDSGPGAVNRDDALWEVLLTIPWSESAGSADCRIDLTAETI